MKKNRDFRPINRPISLYLGST